MLRTDGRSTVADSIRHLSPRDFSNSPTTGKEIENQGRSVVAGEKRDAMDSTRPHCLGHVEKVAGVLRVDHELPHFLCSFRNVAPVFHGGHKQIIISADCPPRKIATLENRLQSRFEWGLIADIQPPDLETKVAIIKKKAEYQSIALPENVALYISNYTAPVFSCWIVGISETWLWNTRHFSDNAVCTKPLARRTLRVIEIRGCPIDRQ